MSPCHIPARLPNVPPGLLVLAQCHDFGSAHLLRVQPLRRMPPWLKTDVRKHASNPPIFRSPRLRTPRVPSIGLLLGAAVSPHRQSRDIPIAHTVGRCPLHRRRLRYESSGWGKLSMGSVSTCGCPTHSIVWNVWDLPGTSHSIHITRRASGLSAPRERA